MAKNDNNILLETILSNAALITKEGFIHDLFSNFSSEELNEISLIVKKKVLENIKYHIDNMHSSYAEHSSNLNLNSLAPISISTLTTSFNSLSYSSVFLCFMVFIFMVLQFFYFHSNQKHITKSKKLKNSEMLFHYTSTSFNERAVNQLKTNVGHYHPPYWYSPILGTIIPFGHDTPITYERELKSCKMRQHYVDWYPYRPLSASASKNFMNKLNNNTYNSNDNDPFCNNNTNNNHYRFDDMDNTSNNNNLKIVLFLPGLGLSSKNKCVKQFVQSLWTAGYYCAVINPRGIDLPLKSDNLWYPGLSDDCESVLRGLECDLPTASLFLVGFSAGTQIIQRTLLHRYKSYQQQHEQQQLQHQQKQSQNINIETSNNNNIDIIDHTLNQNTTVSSLSPSSSSPYGQIKGVMSMCVSQDYLVARGNLESSSLGRFFSFLTAHTAKDLLRQNQHFFQHCHKKKALLEKVLSANSLSELDPHLAQLYGHDNEDQYYEAVSCRNYDHVHLPSLFVQPADDPLHMGKLHDNINIELCKQNKHIIYYEPEYGNHFGFIQGPLIQAFHNTECYTYPAKLAIEFFETILLSSPSSTCSSNNISNN